MINGIFQVLRKASPLVVAVALLFPGGDEASAAQPVVSGEFVGAIPDSDPKDPPGGAADELVAVVVNDPSPTGARAIRAYICDSDSESSRIDVEAHHAVFTQARSIQHQFFFTQFPTLGKLNSRNFHRLCGGRNQ